MAAEKQNIYKSVHYTVLILWCGKKTDGVHCGSEIHFTTRSVVQKCIHVIKIAAYFPVCNYALFTIFVLQLSFSEPSENIHSTSAMGYAAVLSSVLNSYHELGNFDFA